MPTYPTYKLGEICETTSGGTPSRKNEAYYNGSIPWVKSGELGKGIIYDTEEKITEKAVKDSIAKIFPKGTLLIALYGATIGKLGFLGVPAATNQAVCGIFENEKNDLQFLSYYLFHKRNDLITQGTGGAQPNISQTILKNLSIPLPPLATQRAIVTRIESLFAELDKGVEKLKTAQQQLKVYRQAVLNHWLNNDDGKWKLVKLGEICSVLGDGLHGTPKFVENGDFYFINGNNLNGVIVIKQDTKTTNLEEFEKYKKNLNERTILISINGTLGNIAYYNGEPVVLGKSACYFNLLDGIEKDYVKYCLLSERFRSYAFKNATGSTIKNVPLKAMRMYSLPLPPLADQQRIVQEIETRLSACDEVEKNIAESLQQSEALRQSILKKAFSGELV